MKLTTMTDDWLIFHFWEVSEVGSPWFWTRTTPIYLSVRPIPESSILLLEAEREDP